MKKVLFPTLVAMGVALLLVGSTGARGKFHPRQNMLISYMDTVPDSPKKVQFVSLLDTVPDSPKKKIQMASYILDTVPDSPKKIQQYVIQKMDTVPDSPKKVNLIAMR